MRVPRTVESGRRHAGRKGGFPLARAPRNGPVGSGADLTSSLPTVGPPFLSEDAMATPASTLTAEQRELRRGRITSTRIVRLVNGRALDVFNDMMGIAPPVKDNPRMRFGRALERTIIEAAAEDRGWANVSYQPGTVVRDDYATSVDAYACGYAPGDFIASPVRVIEAKNRGAERSREYEGNEPLADEHVQAQWHMDVTGVHAASLCVLLGGNDLRIFDLTHDADLCLGLREIADRFLADHFKPGRPPPMDGSDAASDYIRAKFPTHKAPLLTADPVLETWAVELREATVAADTWTERVETLKNRIKATLGDAEGVQGSFGRISWKATKGRKATDWEGLALARGATTQDIAQFTQEKPGARVFRPTWKETP